MSKPKLECSLIVNPDGGEVIGFSLIAEAQFEAERYCSTFIFNGAQSKAGFSLRRSVIEFYNDGERTFFAFDEEAYYEQLKELFKEDQDLRVDMDGSITPGFKVIKRSEANTYGEYIKLEQI